MAYTPEKPRTAPASDELRRTIPGWGVDLDPADRPSGEREIAPDTGAHWHIPERQPELAPREKSTEHRFVTPVFGTAQPLHGLSGKIRRYAYTLSEARTEHWLLLMLGDRVDLLEHRLAAARRLDLGNPIQESGVLREFKDQAYRTRFGQHRADLKHQPLDLALWALPYAASAAGLYLGGKAVIRGARRVLP